MGCDIKVARVASGTDYLRFPEMVPTVHGDTLLKIRYRNYAYGQPVFITSRKPENSPGI